MVNEEVLYDEFEIVQNRVLCAHILHEFVKYFIKYHKQNHGPSIPLLFPVLPMVLHRETVSSIYRRQFVEGSLIKALNDSPSITLGLQRRMEYHSDKTFKSMNLAFSSKLIALESDSQLIYSVDNKSLVPFPKLGRNYQDMIKASWRIGAWFGLLDEEEILKYLNINF